MGTSKGSGSTSLRGGASKGTAAPVPTSMHPTKGVGHPTGGMGGTMRGSTGNKGGSGGKAGGAEKGEKGGY